MCTHRVRGFTALLLVVLATMACGESTSPGPSGSNLKVEPERAKLSTGTKISLSAQLLDESGKPVIAPSISWVSQNGGVASVSPAGEVTANDVGSTIVVATSGASSADVPITVVPLEPEPGPAAGEHGGYFVSPSGSSGSSGSASTPWDLTTALGGGKGVIQPGDTIWLREGSYSGHFESSLSGSASAPIIVRAYPGERATIDGTIAIEGSYTWYWGFEVANSDAGSQDVIGVDSHCQGCRFINLVIHDHSGDGLGMWSEGPDQEAYGNIIYNNGFHGSTDSSYGHGIYAQNISGAKRVIDNILVNQFGYGIHIYTEDSGMWNFIVTGNTVVNSGQGDGLDFQVGGLQPVENLVFTENMSYRSPGRRGATARLGYGPGPKNSGAMVTGNYLVGKLLLVSWKMITFSGNTILDSSLPKSTSVFVEPNRYEPGRANIVIYNWGDQDAVPVDLSKVLLPGDRYEVRNAQNFYDSPAASGTYGGGSVSIPITSVEPAPSITGKATSSTGTEFNAYVVQRVGQ